jgi:hypothetical protein
MATTEYGGLRLEQAKRLKELEKDAPDPRVAHQRELGEVTALPEIGGPHHRYERRAA